MDTIRNFCIIAHIDHGKSTLADRILELTGVIHTTDNQQILDSMSLERERGITIKAKSVRMPYRSKDGKDYILNLIDTPGHVDFNYEVSRSLKACEGAILLVDASQGVEAQTIANAYLAIDAGLEIIPVINKVDLPNAIIDESLQQLEDMLGLPREDSLRISAKTGAGVPELLEAVITRIPAPKDRSDEPLKCLVFDSFYDSYRGVIPHIRLFAGKLRQGDKILIKSTSKEFDVDEVGYFTPQLTPCEELNAGEVGYVSATIREVGHIHVGDTIVSAEYPDTLAVSGYRNALPMVFCGIYPINTSEFPRLGKALEKLQLNDSSLVYEKETSAALGHGYRLGFMGMLHMEIALERLKREYDQELIATMPSVVYKVVTTEGDEKMIDNPSLFPPVQNIDHIEEPMIRARIIVPTDLIGPCMELSEAKRGSLVNMEYPDHRRTMLTYKFPLSEIITGYYDKLKSVSRGYASMDYEMAGYQEADLVKVDILVHGNQVDALSFISVRSGAISRARVLIHKLRKVIPRHLFTVPLQAAIGSKVIAREDIAPLRKDVIAKCYGGDITRKRKLLEKQKEGKKKMKMVGAVEVPQEAFLLLLKTEE
ncbi:MAG: elongation factor 4 [Dehalococcoidales bacterium]|nr:elongation factor 4 [Dehalococcoidales bacterium]